VRGEYTLQKRAELEATWREEELRRQRERDEIEAELEKAKQVRDWRTFCFEFSRSRSCNERSIRRVIQ